MSEPPPVAQWPELHHLGRAWPWRGKADMRNPMNPRFIAVSLAASPDYLGRIAERLEQWFQMTELRRQDGYVVFGRAKQ